MNHLKLIQNLFGIRESTNGYYHFPCPVCNGEIGRSGVVNSTYPTIRCFQPTCLSHEWASTKSGWVLAYVFLSNVTGKTKKQLAKVAKGLPNVTYQESNRAVLRDLKLPTGIIPITEGKGFRADLARSELYRRGLVPEEMWEKFQIWYSVGGKYDGRLIVPYFDTFGKLIYFQARDYLGYQSRWDNPNFREFGIGKGDIFYNMQILPFVKKLWVHEGPGDVWSNPVAWGIGGSEITQRQYSYLFTSPVDEIIVCLDNGAFSKTLKIVENLLYFTSTKVKALDIPEKGKDPGDVGQAYLAQLYDNEPFMNFDRLDAYTYMMENK
jgi:hypothetical protein